VENLPQLREKLSAICDNYLSVQQDILESFVDRGQLHNLTQPTVLPSGKRIPGLKLDHPRQLALMHALVRFAHIAAGNTFTTAELYPYVLAALQMSSAQFSLASLRYDLSKLRAKGLGRKTLQIAPLSPLPTGLFHLPGISQTLRTCLLTAHSRVASTLPGRLQTPGPQTNPVGSPLSKDRRRSRRAS
jgi:hypothetical protein